MTGWSKTVTRMRPRKCEWPRFSSYELRRGRIVPASGAKLQMYDPWRDYERSKRETRGEPPYLSLISLIDRLNEELREVGGLYNLLLDTEGAAPRLSDSSTESILAWTNKHGLLGVLHQTTIQMEDPSGEKAFTRAVGSWHEVGIFEAHKRSPICMVSQNVDTAELDARDACDYLSKFLDMPLARKLPAPASEEFFAIYGEPLWHWLAAAMVTSEAIIDVDDRVLNALAGAAARLRRVISSSEVKSSIVFPSLVSAFAEMAFQDLEQGYALLRCQFKSCRKVFITDRKLRAYCRKKCANSARQSRFLERNPKYYKRISGRRLHTQNG